MSKKIIAVAAALSTLMASSAMAGSVKGSSFNVQVTVTAGCTISSDLTTVNFGSAAGAGAAPANQTASASILCTKGTPYDFHMDTANSFNMKFTDTAGATYSIPYTITGPNSTLMTTGTQSKLSNTGTGVNQSSNFTFAITNWSPTNAPGTYTDTVTMNVDF